MKCQVCGLLRAGSGRAMGGDSYKISAHTVHDAKTGADGAKVIATYVVEKRAAACICSQVRRCGASRRQQTGAEDREDTVQTRVWMGLRILIVYVDEAERSAPRRNACYGTVAPPDR